MQKRIWRCRGCDKVLTREEEIHNARAMGRIPLAVCITKRFPLCDICLQNEQEAFIHKGGGNDPETAKEE